MAVFKDIPERKGRLPLIYNYELFGLVDIQKFLWSNIIAWCSSAYKIVFEFSYTYVEEFIQARSSKVATFYWILQRPWRGVWMRCNPWYDWLCSNILIYMTGSAQIYWYIWLALLKYTDIYDWLCSNILIYMTGSAQIYWYIWLALLKYTDIYDWLCSNILIYMTGSAEIYYNPEIADNFLSFCSIFLRAPPPYNGFLPNSA